jgi:hypothetical protein
MRGRRESREREAGAGRRAEERHEQQRVDGGEAQRLLRIPEDLQRVERHALREQEATDAGQREGGCAGGERRPEALGQEALRQRDERSRRAVAQHRDADDHVGEVVPGDDREQPREQDLVAERRRGQQQDGRERRPGHRLPVSGTNATGSTCRVDTVPSLALSTSTRCCARNGRRRGSPSGRRASAAAPTVAGSGSRPR